MAKAKKNTMQDYRGQKTDVLANELEKMQIRVQELRGQLAVGKLTSHTQIKAAKREIARIKTVQREKDLLEAISNE